MVNTIQCIEYYNAKLQRAKHSELMRLRCILKLLKTMPANAQYDCDFNVGKLVECIVRYKLTNNDTHFNVSGVDIDNIKKFIPTSEINECEIKACFGNGCYANGNKHSKCKYIVILNECGMYLFHDKYLVYKTSVPNKIKGNAFILNNYEIEGKKVIEYAIENNFISELRKLVGWYGLN